MKTIYRISDNSYPKVKLPGATKEFCLQNFISIFPVDDMIIICDNCNSATIEMVKKQTLGKAELLFTNLSNAGSFRKAMDVAMSFQNNELIYMAEDDYIYKSDLHLKDIIEALEIVDYVTLYDHPDKYQSEYNFGEKCTVFKTKATHWRTTSSTCMTFATKVKTLKEDWKVWETYTSETHPHDFKIFYTLKSQKKDLAVSIPGLACHTDLTYPNSKNLDIDDLIEPWAISLLDSELTSLVCRSDEALMLVKNLDLKEYQGYKKLMLLDALCKLKKPA